MAKIGSFKQDSRAIQQDGEWIRIGEEFDDLEIHCRGFSDRYFDSQAARQRKAAQGLDGDVTKLPMAIRRAINIECLIDHVLLDPPVRNLQHDDGRDVLPSEFLDMLRNPDYAELFLACLKAAGQVGRRKIVDLEDARGNSSAP